MTFGLLRIVVDPGDVVHDLSDRAQGGRFDRAVAKTSEGRGS